MNNWIVDSQGTTAEHLIMTLAGVCNGASTWDGRGFSKIDAHFGHSLATQAQSGKPWSVKQATSALKLINKYRNQLGGTQVIQKWLESPRFAQKPITSQSSSADSTKNNSPTVTRKLRSEQNTAVFSFEFNQDLISAIKNIRGEHKGQKFWASWDAAGKRWTVPVNEGSIVLIMNVALAWDFDIEERFTIFHRRVLDKLAGLAESAKSSQVAHALGQPLGVDVQSGQLIIAHSDPQVLAQFESELRNI